MTSSLSALSLGSATLTPTFSGSVYQYGAALAKASPAAETLTLSATAGASGDVVSATVDNAPITLTKSTNTYTGTVNIPAGTAGHVFVTVKTVSAATGAIARYNITLTYSYTD